MRASRLMREASAQILYLISYRTESAVVVWFSIRQFLSKRSLPRLSKHFLVERVMELLLRTASSVNLFSALTPEIQHATNTGEVHQFTTLLNSDDVATLIPGIRPALLKSVGVQV